MNEFINYIKLGFYHVLDFNGYDHILFLMVLTVVYQFKQWKKVVWLVTLFTIGHTLTLALSAYGILKIRVNLVEFLIPVTIFITALFNIITSKNSMGKQNQNLFFALFFGLIHGLGFSNYFKMLISKSENKLFPLIEFAIGVELAQIVIVLMILVIGTILVGFVKRRDWIIIVSSIVLGLAIQMIFQRWI